MNKFIQKNFIVIVGFIVFYVLFFDRIGADFTSSCTIIGAVLVFYIAILLENFYKFFIGAEFNVGIRMYDIKSVKESRGSKINIFHRRVGAILLVCLLMICLYIIYIRDPC